MLAKSWETQAEQIVGSANVTDPAAWLRERGLPPALAAPNATEPLPQMLAFPSTRDEVCELLRLASAERLRLAVVGNGSKWGMGRARAPVQMLLSLARLNHIVDYPASDLTISVEPGLAVTELAAALAKQSQMLPLDVPFANQATIGGTVAANISGARRMGCGSWRDLVLGIQFVTADGTSAKAGGKVVKNVAGYDIPKLFIGSFGTLGVIVEITFKALPAPPASGTFVLRYPQADQALQAARAIRRSSLAPQAMELLDGSASLMMEQDRIEQTPFTLLVRAVGPPEILARFARDLPTMLMRSQCVPSHMKVLSGNGEARTWELVQELTPKLLRRMSNCTVVKASLPFTQMNLFLEAARRHAGENHFRLCIAVHPGLGIIHCHLGTQQAEDDEAPLGRAAEVLVEAAEKLGGRAAVEWCPEPLKRKINVWGNLRDDAASMRGVKMALDPIGILNPGRFYGGT